MSDHRSPRLPAFSGLLISALVTAACDMAVDPDERSVAGAGRPPVLLISLDTLRADAVGSKNSSGASLTPNMDRLAADGIRYPAATTELPFTLPAHMSLLTGTAPDTHAVFGREDTLPLGVATLAELLAAAGYATGAVVSSDWLNPAFGFERGFGEYVETPVELDYAARINRRALNFLGKLSTTGQPPFLFLHYYDAHSDTGKGGNRRAYWSPAAQSAELAPACLVGQCVPGDSGVTEGQKTGNAQCATRFLLWANHNREQVTAAQRECLAASYRAGVRALDIQLGALFAALESRDLYRRSLIIVTADHGEEFGEHGQFVHAQTFQETVAIPLIIKLPAQESAGEIDPRPAQLADVMPTILQQLDLPLPETLTGSSLLATSLESPETSLVQVSQNKHRPRRYALTVGRWKLIYDFVDQRARLFDLERDPAESKDLAGERSDQVDRLKALLDAHRQRLQAKRAQIDAGAAADGAGNLSEEAVRRLESLGYVQ